MFFVGMPRDAAGPVAQIENPTVRSAAATGRARLAATAVASARRKRVMRTSPGWGRGADGNVYPGATAGPVDLSARRRGLPEGEVLSLVAAKPVPDAGSREAAARRLRT